MKNRFALTFFLLAATKVLLAQNNAYPTTGDVKIFSSNSSWAEGLAIVKSSGWSGIRLTRNDPVTGNYGGNWAIGYNNNTANDFSISTNYSGTQYDGLFHISNSTRNVGIGTTSPQKKLEVVLPANDVVSIGSQFPVGQYSGLHFGYLETNNTAYRKSALVFERVDGSARGKIHLLNNGGADNTSASLTDSKMTIDFNGNVGIGSTSPTSLFHVKSTTSSSIVNIQSTTPNQMAGVQLINDSGNVGLSVLNYGSTYASGTYDRANGVSFHTTASAGSSGGIAIAARNPSGYITLHSGGNTERMRIDANGNVGIGTTSPNQLLTVNGTIYGKEVKVDLSVPGPDYVFEEDYQLIPLEEIKTYIDQNKHLPDVPSAKEMEEDGIQLGEMNMLLLRKIEELTLYIIDQRKELDELKQRSVSPDTSGKKMEELTLYILKQEKRIKVLESKSEK